MDTYDTGHLYDHPQVLEREEMPLGHRERLSSIKRPLLARYSSRTRPLPWRDNPKLYRIWISEVVFQQTKVKAVKPCFERFMEASPTASHLAQAEDDYLVKMWEGLGYYNRVRNLKTAARMIMSEYGGCPPASFDGLIRLPRIGSYTAGAIASITYGIPLPAMDGNVLRIISGVLGDRGDTKRASMGAGIEAEPKDVMPRDEASHYNRGLIGIGALVCISGGEPRCSQCPLASICLTRKNGWWGEIPCKSLDRAREIEERTAFIIEYQDGVAIHKRPPRGLLASLYESSNIERKASGRTVPRVLGLERERMESAEQLPKAEHVFSHMEWHTAEYRVVLSKEGNPLFCFMISREDLKQTYTLLNVFNTCTELIG